MNQIPRATQKKAKALLVEGGGMRGAFSGGVLSEMCTLYPASNFDLLLGVSAGSCSLAYYASEDRRSFFSQKSIPKIWKEELHGNRFISFRNLFKGSTLLNQKYLIDDLIFQKYKLKLEKFQRKMQTPFFVTVTNLKSLQPEYIRITSENVQTILKAATSLPIATRGKHIFRNQTYSDGGISDPLPIRALVEAGYRDITLILNHSRDYLSLPINRFLAFLSFPLQRKVRTFLRKEHHKRYNDAKRLLHSPPPGVKLQIIDPSAKIPVRIASTIQKDLIDLFEHGREVASRFFR